MVELYVEKKKNEKKGTEYIALYADYGYTIEPVCFEEGVIMAMLNITKKDLYEIKIGDKLVVGTITKKADK